jgi:transposase
VLKERWTSWRKASRAARRSTADAENERLRRENEKLAAKLARTKAALEAIVKTRARGGADIW